MRNRVVAGLLTALVGGALLTPATGATARQGQPHRLAGRTTEYVVVYEEGVDAADARAAVKRLGGEVLSENAAVGVATVRTRNSDFLADAADARVLSGAARNRVIGVSEPDSEVRARDVERVMKGLKGRAGKTSGKRKHDDPLAYLQWGNHMIHATAANSYSEETGDRKVLVGILDTGVDASHPDIRPNFNRRLSRNFTTDMEDIDGPCAEEPDGSCEDPADVDEGGHGTHVAGIVGASLNDLGTAGVAPDVSIVNLRAGQDSGFFFLQASVDALTYAGDNGIDVVNMSYYIDPWLYNCTDNPADSPEAQAEQAAIIEATQRAVDYAYEHGVTLLGAAGNEHTDLGHPTFDGSSPDYPPDTNYDRTVDNECLDMPTEANHVMSISALGPSGRKSYFSNYGVEQTTVSAPGGDSRDFFNTPRYRTAQNLILSTYPKDVAIEEELIDENMQPLTPSAVVDCAGGGTRHCGVYVYLQGTSMASPYATGVSSLIVSAFGEKSRGGITMDPAAVEERLRATATDMPCPEQNPYIYPDLVGADPNVPFEAFCEGNEEFNGFYGDGVVDALNAVTAE
jgi:lantibiotic leader peptide-processing serine protease